MILKGAVESVSQQRIDGWIYCDLQPLRGAEIQAFLDSDCVGAGRVDRFRQDLADAKLGDGFCGFSFPILLANETDAEHVYVRLSGSDVILLPPKGQVRTANRHAHFRSLPINASSLEFMRIRGWIENADLSFLKYVCDLGVFDQTLVRSKVDQQSGLERLIDPITVAQHAFDLLTLTAGGVARVECVNPSADYITSVLCEGHSRPMSVVGLLSDRACSINVVEGSHRDKLMPTSQVGSVQHLLGPDRILFLNLLCAFDFVFEEGETNISLFIRR